MEKQRPISTTRLTLAIVAIIVAAGLMYLVEEFQEAPPLKHDGVGGLLIGFGLAWLVLVE